MSDKKEGAIYQCDAGHWYVQSVGSGPGSWSLPFVGCPVCKLERASKFANANAEDVESLQGKVRELESLCSSQALRLQEALDARNERSAQFVAACQENLMLSSRLDSGRRIAQHWADQHSACAIEILSTLVEIPAPISHVGCVLCDGSGWKDIMIGAETKRLPCSGPIPVPLE